jgi:hypothetical protein
MGEADFRGGESLNGKRFSETLNFTKKEAQGLAKLATDQNTCVEEVIRRAVFQYLYNCYPDLKGWRIPRSLFVTLAVPEVVHKKLKLWTTLKHKLNVSVDEHGILILDGTALKEYSKQDRFVLLKVPASWEKKAAEKGPTEVVT